MRAMFLTFAVTAIIAAAIIWSRARAIHATLTAPEPADEALLAPGTPPQQDDPLPTIQESMHETDNEEICQLQSHPVTHEEPSVPPPIVPPVPNWKKLLPHFRKLCDALGTLKPELLPQDLYMSMAHLQSALKQASQDHPDTPAETVMQLPEVVAALAEFGPAIVHNAYKLPGKVTRPARKMHTIDPLLMPFDD